MTELTQKDFNKFLKLDISHELDINGDREQCFEIEIELDNETKLKEADCMVIEGLAIKPFDWSGKQDEIDVEDVTIEVFIGNDVLYLSTEQINKIINKIQFSY